MNCTDQAKNRCLKQMSAVWVVFVLSLVLAAHAAAAPVPLSKTEATVSKSATSLPGPTYTWVAMPEQRDVQKDARVRDPE